MSLFCLHFTTVQTLPTYLYHVNKRNCSQHQVNDIGMTVKKHRKIIKFILVAHTLLGCDAASHFCGIEKQQIVRVLQMGLKFVTNHCKSSSNGIKVIKMRANGSWHA